MESRQQLHTPPPESDEHGSKVTGIEETSVEPPKPAEQKQTPNLKRPAEDDDDAETKTPAKVARKGQTTREPRTPKKAAQSEEALAKKLESAKKKAEEAAVKAANAAKRKEAAEAKKAEKERKNVNSYNQMPQRQYKWDDCGKLAFRKEAMLAGISQENEEEFFAKGKKLFADKNARG
ncbi:hypothetical protein J4E90_010674, partial [Alternaria incomplexa]|uniref:uncharacterized protein n=1 Tax=Alternaria incomplexa TaxID=1187928 RepID=UPI00221F1ACD